MSNQKIIDYINDCKQQGFSSDEIKNALYSAGWSKEEVNQAFSSLENKPEKPAEPSPNLEKKELKKKKFKLNKIEIIIIVAFVAIISTALIFFTNIFSVSSFERNLGRSISTISNLNSYAYEVSLKLDLDFSESDNVFLSNFKEVGYVSLGIDGKTDLANEYTLSETLFNLQTSLLEEYIEIPFNIKTIDDKIYLNVASAPEDFRDFIPTDKFLNTWIEFDLVSDGDDFSVNDFLKQEDLDDLLEVIVNNLDVSELFIILEEDEVVLNDYDNYYYKLTINKEKFPDFIVNTYQDAYYNYENLRHILDSEIEIKDEMSSQDWQEIRQEIAEEMENFDFYTFELWIKKDSFLPHKISTNIDFSSQESGIKANLEVEFLFKEFNQDYDIDIPSNTIKAEELINQLLVPTSTSFDNDFEADFDFSTPNSRDAQKISDIRIMQTALELYYNIENKYPDYEEFKSGEALKDFLGSLPSPPSPDDCAYNSYNYFVADDNQSYCIEYCLSTDMFQAKYASPDSINIGSICPIIHELD